MPTAGRLTGLDPGRPRRCQCSGVSISVVTLWWWLAGAAMRARTWSRLGLRYLMRSCLQLWIAALVRVVGEDGSPAAVGAWLAG